MLPSPAGSLQSRPSYDLLLMLLDHPTSSTVTVSIQGNEVRGASSDPEYQ
jgi:hypothetical protein